MQRYPALFPSLALLMGRLWSVILLTSALMLPAALKAQANTVADATWDQISIPPPTPETRFVGDFAGVITPDDRLRIFYAQRHAFSVQGAPIIVVTVSTMGSFGARSLTIDQFARAWYDEWEIGTIGHEETPNRGILLLVSTGDRQAHIEMGSAWDPAYSVHSRHLIDTVLLPKFRARQDSEGIVQGVEAIGRMVARDPENLPVIPAEAGLWERLRSDEPLTRLSMLPARIGYLTLLLGIILIGASAFVKEERNLLMIAGFSLLISALFTYAIVIVLGILSRLLLHFEIYSSRPGDDRGRYRMVHPQSRLARRERRERWRQSWRLGGRGSTASESKGSW